MSGKKWKKPVCFVDADETQTKASFSTLQTELN